MWIRVFLNHTRQTITSEKKTKMCSHELNNIHPMGPQRKIQSTSTRKTNILNTTGAKRPPCSLARSIMRCWITPSGLSSLKRTRTILSRSCISKECRALYLHTNVWLQPHDARAGISDVSLPFVLTDTAVNILDSFSIFTHTWCLFLLSALTEYVNHSKAIKASMS